MRCLYNFVKLFRPVFQAMGLAILLLGLSWVTLSNSTAKSSARPNTIGLAGSSVLSASVQIHTDTFLTSAGSNPVANAYINAIPSSDGTEIAVFASGVNATNPIVLNVDPGSGGSGSQGSHAMTLSGTTYIANAIGFAPGQDVGNAGDATMNITTTIATTSGNQIVSTGDINFQRAFLLNSVATEAIVVDGGAFKVTMPNANTFPTDIYAVVMSTNTPPGPLPTGYGLVGSTYNFRSSGSLSQSNKLMTLNLGFNEPLPNNSDPHTLAIIRWNPSTQSWNVLGGNLFDDNSKNYLDLAIKRFGIYALATTPTWADTFKEPLNLTGVSSQNNTTSGPNDTIILGSGTTSGTVISIPITATNAISWNTLHFSATTSLNTNLTVDVLDAGDHIVLANVGDGANLSSLSLTAYPSLKLRATLTSTTVGLTPELYEWGVSWEPNSAGVTNDKVYLPIIIK